MNKPIITMTLALAFVLVAKGSMAVTPDANKATPRNSNTESTVRQQEAVRHFQINRSTANLEISPGGEVLERRPPLENAQHKATPNVIENNKMRRGGVNHLQIDAAGSLLVASDAREDHAETQKDQTYTQAEANKLFHQADAEEAAPVYKAGKKDGSCPAGSQRVQNAECQKLDGKTLTRWGKTVDLKSWDREDCAEGFTPGTGCFYNKNGNTYSTAAGCTIAAGGSHHFAVCKAEEEKVEESDTDKAKDEAKDAADKGKSAAEDALGKLKSGAHRIPFSIWVVMVPCYIVWASSKW